LFGQDGWMLATLFFCKFMDLNSTLVHKHTNKELGQYQAILTALTLWPALQAGKVNQFLRRDWLPWQASWSYLACSRLPTVSHNKNVFEIHIINPVLTTEPCLVKMNVYHLLFL